MPTIVHAKAAGVLKVPFDVRAACASLPAVNKTSCCGIWNAAELKKVVSLVTVEVPTQTCRQTESY